MTKRLQCCVPYCERSTGRFPDSSEWICAEHWRLAPKRLKRVLFRARRHLKAGRDEVHNRRVNALAWRLIRKAVIEAALGI